MQNSPDVLIVGAGPVGLTMATMLERQGVSLRIVDKLPVASDRSKALVVWARTLELLQKAGLSEKFVERGHFVHSTSIIADGKRIMHASLDQIPSPFNNVLMLAQNETESLLTEHLASVGHNIERTVELVSFQDDGQGVDCELRDADGKSEKLRVSYLIGCDGAHSTVRHQLDMPFEGHTLKSTWALADADVEGLEHDDEMMIFWNSDGILALFPMGGLRARVIVAVDDKFEGDTLTLENMQSLVDRWVARPWKLSNPRWLTYFTINERKVKDYSRGRVFLAGDAAHIHSPAGGQGMNTGMQDACNLAWKLALVLQGHASPSLLESYNQERTEIGEQIVKNADRLTTVATLKGTIKQHLRNRLVGFMTSLGPVQKKAAEQLAELSIAYDGSPICGEHRDMMAWLLTQGPKPGHRAPQASVTADGKATTLFDVLKSKRHVMLLMGGLQSSPTAREALRRAAALAADHYGDVLDCFSVGVDDALGLEGVPVLIDAGEQMHREYGAAHPTIYVIRPDGYVGFRSQPADPAALEKWLQQIFAPLTATAR